MALVLTLTVGGFAASGMFDGSAGASVATPTSAHADKVTRFIVLGDPGTGGAAQYATAAAMEEVCAARGCDFVLVTGDNIYETGVTSPYDPQFVTKFEEPYANFTIPFYLTIGNHDSAGGPTVDVAGSATTVPVDPFGLGAYHANADHQVAYHYRTDRLSEKWNMPARWYSFTANDHVQFFSIDANALVWMGHPLFTKDPLGNEQAEWLRAEMTASTAEWKIVFGHQPFLSNGEHGNAGTYNGQHETHQPGDNTLSVRLREFIEDEVCEHADYYVSGHDHDLQWLKPVDRCGRTEFIVSGAAARMRDLADPTRNPAFFQQGSQLGFFWVKIVEDQLTGVVFDENGDVLYERSMTRRDAA